MLWLLRGLLSAVFLLSIVLSIPIAFDVGGRDSGLAYSLALFLYYLLYSTVRISLEPTDSSSRSSRSSRSSLGGSILRSAASLLLPLSQWIMIPALLIWSLGKFAVDAHDGGNWVERTLEMMTSAARAGAGSRSVGDWIFGKDGVVETLTLGGWDWLLSYSSPVFQLLEGFCSLLVIQTAGQLTRWIVNRGRSDTWMIFLLALSGSIMASAVYFLWRVATFPQISHLDAALIAVTMTSAVFLCALGIGTGRGNPVESSLLFAYVVLCVYQIFTDYMPSHDAAAGGYGSGSGSGSGAGTGDSSGGVSGGGTTSHPDAPPPLPPIIMASYTTLLHMMGSLPRALRSTLALLYAAFQTITPSVIISLTFRIFVLYCATRIIPAIRESGARAFMQEPTLDDSDTASRLLGFLSWFSPSILIAVYTSLLLQHFSASDGPDGWTLRGGNVGGNMWKWTNVAVTMLLYGVELYMGNDEHGHWKVE